MKVLIIGANGMLGKELTTELEKNMDVYGFMLEDDRRPRFSKCDITDRVGTIKSIERINPKIVVHTAAMTDVDGCESNRAEAMRVNFEGTKNVVDGCRHVKALMVYVSTDFVFSGNKKEPYIETTLPHPINVYGESKLLGEFYVRDQSSSYLIIRTAWLFGIHGSNFMSKILAKARESKELQVVCDQKGSPTHTRDLARAIHVAIQKISRGESKEAINTIYHAANNGAVTKYEIACELLKQANLADVKVVPIESSELEGLGHVAKRPANSVLNSSRFERTFGFKFLTWQEAISEYLKIVQG